MGTGGNQIQKKKEKMNIEDNYATCIFCQKLLLKKIMKVVIDHPNKGWACDKCVDEMLSNWSSGFVDRRK